MSAIVKVSGQEAVSGSILIPPQESVEIQPFGQGDTLSIAWRIGESGGQETGYDVEVVNNQVRFTLKNFDSPLGITLTQPLEIGRKLGQAVMLTFAVHAIGTPVTHVLNYTIWLVGGGALFATPPIAGGLPGFGGGR